ncbi:helix-turn-helix domain-containing protein [Streptomyces sp. ET3-23]|uniref:helix-turn-helix domain-containing protein n=1 Tax=Streptomyces sp. ET3-23 TaxID=2885643 RepID=UPI001D1062B1|nr:helix-turn-helix domain-containing protein [Streptomyces sp. ET3-23]MCC2280348.1 helix-turn-helix domain-containing protein [Streptomyces sp. ET3-23]
MRRWKALPGSLDDRVRQLVVALRRLKDRSGLSLAALAAKTSYSRSSWERCLNGRQLPSRDAVEELARVCAVDPARLLVLHELAAEAWSDSRPAPVTEPRPAGRRVPGRCRVLVAAVAVPAVVLAVALLLTRPWQDDHAQPGNLRATAGPSLFVYMPHRAHPCNVKRQDGELRAGYSATRTALMETNSTGWEIVEAQCLLKYHGYDPGAADGAYGERSKSAAEHFQKDHDLVVDGIVGPDTWKELRR